MSRGEAEQVASESPATRDQEGVERFIALFAASGIESGMPPMPARVFAAMMISDSGRLTAAELAEILRISPAAVSGAVRYLVQLQLLTREREVGSRRDTYVLPAGFWYEVMATRSPLIDRWIEAFAIGVAAVERESPAAERLAESLDFFEFIREELPAALARWRQERKPR